MWEKRNNDMTFFSWKSFEEYINKIKYDIGVKGTHVLQNGYLNTDAIEKNFNIKIKWHRSRERRSNSYSPFCAYMMNKKWWLEEEFTNHILRFQQVEYMYNWMLYLTFSIFEIHYEKKILPTHQYLFLGRSCYKWNTLGSEGWT